MRLTSALTRPLILEGAERLASARRGALSLFVSYKRKMKNKFLITVIFLLQLNSCDEYKPIVAPMTVEPKYSHKVSGYIELENQTDYSNALIYLDSLDVGCSTYPSGFYELQLDTLDTLTTGIFTVYYFLYDYNLDSNMIYLKNGKLVSDTLDVDSDCNLIPKKLSQIFRIEGTTDRSTYHIGDSLWLIVRIVNLEDTTIIFTIYNGGSLMNTASLYNEKYPSFLMTPEDILLLQRGLVLSKDSIYQEIGSFKIPAGTSLLTGFYPIPSDSFIVLAGSFDFSRTDNPIFDNIYHYLRFDWFNQKLPSFHSLEYDFKPNKYEFPHVMIIN